MTFDLTAHLTATGAANPDRITRHLTTSRCRKCSAPILTALDADVCGWPVTLDPYLLDAAGELAALLTGRATYRLSTVGDWDIQARDQFTIPAEPPGGHDSHGRQVLAVATHRCRAPLSVTAISRPAIATGFMTGKEPTW